MIPDTVFTLDKAKAHLRVDFADEDALITALLDAAVAQVETITRHAWTERNIVSQVTAKEAVAGAKFYAPLSPVTDVEIKTVPGGDVVPDTDVVIGEENGTSTITVKAWPSSMATEGIAGTMTMTAEPLGAHVPPDVYAAAMLYLGDLYANREAQIVGTITARNATADLLLQSHVIDLTA